MVAEVNRLIANLLAAGEPIAFPEVGMLRPVTRPAQRLSRRKVLPPVHTIDFLSEQLGTPLTEQLMRAAGCTKEQADDIYSRWLAQTWQQEVLTLEGIGLLRQKQFTLDAAFDKRVNPQGHDPIVVRRRRHGFDWMMAVGLIAIVAAAVIGWFGYKELKGSVRMPWEREQANAVVAATPVDDATATAEPTAATAPQAGATESTATAHQTADKQPNAGAGLSNTTQTAAPASPLSNAHTPSIERMQSGDYYVVLGVFSAPENAERAVREANAKDRSVQCRIYIFGQKWMVSPYTSSDQAETARFRKEHLASFPEMWVYRAR